MPNYIWEERWRVGLVDSGPYDFPYVSWSLECKETYSTQTLKNQLLISFHFSVVQVVPNTFGVLIFGRLLTYVEATGL